MINYLLQTLEAVKPFFGDSILLFSVAIGVAFSLIALAMMYLAGIASSPVRRRLVENESSSDTKFTSSNRAKKIDKAVAPIKPYLIPGNTKELSESQRRLVHAGFRGEESVTAYYAIKVLAILGFAVIAGLLAYAFTGITSLGVMMAMIFGALVGLIAPSYYIDKKIEKRKSELINGFPDVLDLLVACTEAGLGLNAALQRVARETTTMFPVLSGELELVNGEIAAGVDRVEALHRLSERTGVDEISGFVSVISQSVKFGTSIADTLRIYSAEFRDKRMQKAEEQAAKIGTKLIFPLVLCIFPSFFVVAIGPAVISIIRVFEQMR